MRPDLLQRVAVAQAERANKGLLRALRASEFVDGARVVIGGRRLLNFASNDYLGLAGHPAVGKAMIAATQRWGVGSGAAHLLGGHRAAHAELEAALAAWTGRDRALLFSTGYMANLGVMQALLTRGDLCVQDKLNHASLIDAAHLTGCELKRYRHADVASARQQLASVPHAAALLATDGVFSMDGDVAPLAELAASCRESGATFMVDDAHGLGVLGANGAGSLIEAGLTQSDAPILMGTLGKSLGVAGAFVAGAAELIDALVQFSRTFIYTTAMPAALAAAASAALEIARDDGERRANLAERIAQFRSGAAQRGIRVLDSRTPIQPVPIGASNAVTRAATNLHDSGFYVPAIRAPTVADGTARLRITLSAAHSAQDVENLLDALSGAIA